MSFQGDSKVDVQPWMGDLHATLLLQVILSTLLEPGKIGRVVKYLKFKNFQQASLVNIKILLHL